ncbi:MAG: NUDIX domain-containing protein [bacterium]
MSDKPILRRQGPWTIHSEQIRFDNPWLTVTAHEVTLPSGGTGDYGVVSFKNLAVGVLPLDQEGFSWIVGQHRFPLNQYSWELPEGGGPLDQSAQETAARELAEETGLRAGHFAPLCEYYTSNSVTDEKAIAYIAWDLQAGTMAPDPTEVLEVRRISFAELLENVISGDITDGFTVTMVMSAYIKAEKNLLPEPVCRLIKKGLSV